MAHTDDRRYQYLESLDSTRTGWPGAGPAGDGHDAELHLQVFTEVLMTLALGREVVVPQAYAFDSFGFLRVATTVLRARSGAAAGEHPFRVHLFGVHSYEEAVAAMLGRAVDRARPFMSSLLPELNDPAAHGLDPGELRVQAASLDRLLNAEWLGTERADGMALIRDEFRRVPRVPVRPAGRTTGLGALVIAAAEPPPPELPEAHRGVQAALTAAIRRLGTDHPAAFDDRSRLRLALPWPGDRAERTPAEIVGDPELLTLLVDFVDTLYNMIVADSVGVADSTISTGTGPSLRRLADRGIAKELALAHYRSSTHPDGAGLRPDGDEQAEGPPLFDIRVDVAAGLGEEAVHDRMTALLADAAEATATLLQARAERGRAAKSPFWKGIEDLRAAEDPTAARKALDAHLARVAAILGNRADIVPTGGGLAVELVLTAAGAVGPAMASEVWKLPGLVGYPAMAVGAVGSVLYRKGKENAVRRLSTRRLACALGRVVDVRG
ncbi:hypothetical protein [Streptomyces sp. TLI_171]|uniref:hypothetical protein n=1 Tax=Streptomyces sp. TLI_171 TaxID=1938859 RepID=UPI000C176EDE|nr:hypothetical protein [Streptomyces sp. TLI_171]RKE20150.1 hypothetical protein BX266_3498 [Streptomyces sp. TLI_171]